MSDTSTTTITTHSRRLWKHRHSFMLLLIVCLLMPLSQAFAQQNDTEDSTGAKNPFEGKPVISLQQQTPEHVISMARRYIRARDYQTAADLLEDLYSREKSPMVQPVIENLLRTCYDQLKMYDKLELLLRRMISQKNDNWRDRIYLAELLAKTDRQPQALALYDSVFTQKATDPNAVQLDKLILRSMLQSALDSAVLAHIDHLRSTTGDKTLFALERGEVLEGRREYSEAAREYLPVLNEDSTVAASEAEKKLLELLAFPESSSEVEKFLLTMADSATGRRTLTLLTDHYLEIGQYDKAFSTALRRDSVMSNSGFALLDYMRQCTERKAWAEVARMGDTLYARGVRPKLAPEVTFTYGKALEQLGRYDDAIDRYKSLVATAPHSAIIGDALYAIGAVYGERKGDYATARAYYDSVVTYYPHGMSYVNALTALPECYLKQGMLDSAEQKFSQTARMDLPEPAKEEMDYYLAMVHMYKGEFDTAAVDLQRLMVEHPRGFYVNDALQQKMVMRSASNAPDLLGDYARAELYKYRGMTDSTKVQYEKLVNADNKALADLALYRLSELQLGEADSAAALQSIDLLQKGFPDSYYLPLGLKTKADLLAKTEDGVGQAKAIYKLLLEQYADYPFTSEVRETLRKMESHLES